MASTKIARSTSFARSFEPVATGDIAADAFARFDRGMPPDQVVTELVLPVDTVEYLWRTWARLRGVVPLSADAERAFREALFSNRPIANGGDAVAAVRRFVERPLKPCPRCRDGVREYCTICPAKEATRAARGAQRGSPRKRPAQNNHAGQPHGTEAAAAREGDASPDVITDNKPNEFCAGSWSSKSGSWSSK
jgi:hypothetical protein